MKKETKKEFPHVGVILLWILVIAMILTWILPAVSYETYTNPETGILMIDESTVKLESVNKIMPWELPNLLISAAYDNLSIILIISVLNGAFAIMIYAGTFEALIAWTCNKFGGKEAHVVAFLLMTFSLFNLIIPPFCFIAFIPTIVVLAIRLGYDAIVGISIVLFGCTTACISAPLSSTTLVCQKAVGLPIYSGIGIRFVIYFIYLIVTLIYVLRYAKRVKRDPKQSYLYGRDIDRKNVNIPITRKLSVTDIVVLIILLLVFVGVIFGCIKFGWGMDQICAVFIVFAIVSGVIYRMKLSRIIELFINGIAEMTDMAVICVIAGSITSLLSASGIIGTIIYYAYQLLKGLPGVFVVLAIMLLVSVMNAIVPSGPAKGLMLMPLVGPLGQLMEVTMQTTVQAYTFGDVFSNYILPYDPGCILFLGAAKVEFNCWFKYMLKLVYIWYAVGIVILIWLYFMNWGPF